MGLEAAEQFNWQLPDAIFYPTGGGVGMIGMWKAFDELEQLGWIGKKRPKMIAVQAEGCQPIMRAFEQNAESSTFWEGADTLASGPARTEGPGRLSRAAGGAAKAWDRNSSIGQRDDAGLRGTRASWRACSWRPKAAPASRR